MLFGKKSPYISSHTGVLISKSGSEVHMNAHYNEHIYLRNTEIVLKGLYRKEGDVSNQILLERLF